MQTKIMLLLAAGGIARYYLANSPFAAAVGNRVETPLNSFKRLKEGIYLHQQGIDPYIGDVVHETPLVLVAFSHIFQAASAYVPLLYVLLDLLTAVLLYQLSGHFVRSKLRQQAALLHTYAAGTEELQMQPSDLETIPRFVLFAYLFNPMSLFSCAGLTSTVISNLLLAATLFFMSKRLLLPCMCCLALESMRNLYPVVLIAPVILIFSSRRTATSIVGLLTLFAALCAGILCLNFALMHNWNFLDGSLGFIFMYRDLRPNIGIFWYFFTEMFEHFRTMFLITFQMNATVLYLVPLSVKLRKEPQLLATVLVALMCIFRSYPCLGDVSLYLSLLPLWRRCWKFMAHKFIVFGFFVVTLCAMPALWYLWIYAGSANANFFFGTTLAFSTGQIFLVTDLLFAYVKREFCLINGKKIYIDGKEAKIILE